MTEIGVKIGKRNRNSSLLSKRIDLEIVENHIKRFDN